MARKTLQILNVGDLHPMHWLYLSAAEIGQCCCVPLIRETLLPFYHHVQTAQVIPVQLHSNESGNGEEEDILQESSCI